MPGSVVLSDRSVRWTTTVRAVGLPAGPARPASPCRSSTVPPQAPPATTARTATAIAVRRPTGRRRRVRPARRLSSSACAAALLPTLAPDASRRQSRSISGVGAVPGPESSNVQPSGANTSWIRAPFLRRHMTISRTSSA